MTNWRRFADLVVALFCLMSFIELAPAREAGLDYRLTAQQPYKLFLASQADLNIVFPAGWRTDHRVNLSFTLLDLWQNVVAQGSSAFDVPASGEVASPLPPIILPRLGWYRLDTSLARTDGTLLSQQTNLISRTFDDPTLPIPLEEVSGWNDMATHKMIGMGLHRFTVSKLADLPTLALSAVEAKKLQVPYFYQLTYKADVTPANVDAILSNQPDLPLLEIMNEPDQQGVSPEDYVANYLKPCYQEAHRIEPGIQVMGPAECGIELAWMDRFFKAGGGRYVDAISVHTYERNNSMDAYHWNWKLAKLKEMMAAAGCGNKPLYQSEHGYLGNYHDYILRPQWQARSVFEEYLCFDRVGTGPDRFFYYYVNEAGYTDFSAELIDHDRELYPAALLMRMRAHFLRGTHYDSTIDLGPVGNLLILANRYVGAERDVLVLMNTGADKAIELSCSLPQAAQVYDCWGNPAPPSPHAGQLSVGIFPSYVTVPHGASVTAALPWSGRNIAPEARFIVDDPQAQASTNRLTNGRLEFDFNDEPLVGGMDAGIGRLPLTLTATWSTPRTINHVILYGGLADNGHCTPLDYTLEARVNGNWWKVDEVHVPAEGKILKDGNIARISSYADPWIFLHEFSPITADAIRFHFTQTTIGQYPNAEIYRDLLRADHIAALAPAVQIRELQVFSPSPQ
jgi:hypothetical protein